MRIKKIKLKNIRSYEEQEVEFPDGSILLSGDIGSGKTSILLAIEFALFGLQPGQRGSSLLKNGEKDGGVILLFEVDGQEVIVERTLKRGKAISQDYCSITIDGGKQEIAVTELKDKILSLLSYPKEFSKKQNLLYKFTVYTPQEEMKEIILQDAETRINTLRHVFGIDKYKKVLENAGIVAARLREEKRLKEGLTAGLDQERLDLESKEKELDDKSMNLMSLEKEVFLKREASARIQEEIKDIQSRVDERKKIEQEIEKAKIMIINKMDAATGNKKMLSTLQEQIKELLSISFDESEIASIGNEIKVKIVKRQELLDKNLEVASQINSLSLKNKESNSIKENISRLDICPTCLQDVDPNYKANVSNKLDADISKNLKDIEVSSVEKKKLSLEILNIDAEISLKEKAIQDLRILKIKIQDLNDKKKRYDEISSSLEALEKDIAFLNKHIESLKDIIFELGKYQGLFDEKQKELNLALKNEKLSEIRLAELKKEIEVFSHQIAENKKRIARLEEIKKQLNYISSLESWLSKDFVSLVSSIEKNVMVKLKGDFSRLLQEWFLMLVPENFNIKLDENFTPIIEQHDYEIDYAYLSGGERTAVALAYRLALNQVINSLLSKIKTRDFVILDEPTDGFSESQLDKMRSVLEQLKVNQLIIVSHEQKIEGFVDNVIKIRKDGGVSKKYS
ncbi:hypothetical protein HYT23_00430 [Candidatus Pacearchaeota archaeon]|nr:hypothetical protein [Candidatus Pacearchaeota archaeon]